MLHSLPIISKWLNLCLFESVRPQIWEGVNKARDEKQERALCDQKYLIMLQCLTIPVNATASQLSYLWRRLLCRLPAMEPVHT